MASLRKMDRKTAKNGYVWQAVIEQKADPLTGKRNRIYKTLPEGITKAEAWKIARAMETDIDNDSYIKNHDITVAEYFNDWLNTYIIPHKSPTTAETYSYNVRNYILPKFGKLRLQDLTTLMLQRWFNSLKISPLSGRELTPKTIRNIWLNLSAGLKRAVQLEYLKKNPAENIELPKCKTYQAEVYDTEEIRALINAAQGTDMEVGIMTLLLMGLRRGELLAIKFEHIDYDNGILSIVENAVQVKDKIVIKDPKTANGTRKLEIPGVLLELFERERSSYTQRKIEYGTRFNDTNLLICQPDGSPYRPDWYSEKFKRFLKANGLKRIRLHDLRHTNATLMLRLGIHAKVMAHRLGHGSIGITLQTYSHVINEMSTEANAKLEAGLKDIMG